MSKTHILPVIYTSSANSGHYATSNDLFSSDTLYEVLTGPHAGLRGSRRTLEKLLGPCTEADPYAAISCETGMVLLHLSNAAGMMPAIAA